MNYMIRQLMLLCFVLFLGSGLCQTAFVGGNVVVCRIGSGAGVFTGANNVYLDEYTPAGTFVRTLGMPTASGSALLQSSNNDEGYLSLSPDGRYLTLVGYSKANGSGVYSTTAVATPRSIGVVRYDGTVSVVVPAVTAPVASSSGTVVLNGSGPTTITGVNTTGVAVGQYVYGSYVPDGATVAGMSGSGAGSTVTLNVSGGRAGSTSMVFMAAATPQYANIKSPGSAVTANGTDFWLCSRETSIQYYSQSSGTLTNIASGTTGTTARSLDLVDGQLYASNDFGFKLAKVGSGMPSATATVSGLSYAPGSFAPQSAGGFCMLDASGSEAGADVMYAVETVGGGTNYGIVKYSKVGGLWTVNGGYGTYADSYQGLTGVLSGGTVTLYAVRKVQGLTNAASGELVKVVDANGYNAAMSGTEAILAASASSSLGGAWRGVAMAPEMGTVPLTLISFAAMHTQKDNVLKWATAKEVDIAGFDIEKSTDAVNYTTIASLAANNRGGQSQYSFTDKNVLEKTVYYRLKMKDKDGRYTYSNIVTIKIGDTSSAKITNVYPNPSSDMLHIDYNAVKSNTFLNIYDERGRLLRHQDVPTGNGQLVIEISSYSAGLHMLELVGQSASGSFKFIKK